MTSLQMNMNSVPAAALRSGGTTAYCEASPSPVSPITMNDSASSPAKRVIGMFGSTPSRFCACTQRMRSESVGSPNQRAILSLRDSQSGRQLTQENCLRPTPGRARSGSYSGVGSAQSVQPQPAASRDVRDERISVVCREALDGKSPPLGGRATLRRCLRPVKP